MLIRQFSYPCNELIFNYLQVKLNLELRQFEEKKGPNYDKSKK